MKWYNFQKVEKSWRTFKLNKDDSGKLVKHKVWLVVKGFVQMKEIDFDEIFSLVVKMLLVGVDLGLDISVDLELKQMDVKTVFLHGDLKEKIYMT